MTLERPYDRALVQNNLFRISESNQDGQGCLREFTYGLSKHVLYEDRALLVVNKPAGVTSHSGEKNPIGVEEICRFVNQNPDITLAHRLDRDTSGALILAKTPEAHLHLKQQFEQKTKLAMRYLQNPEIIGQSPIKKTYLAVVDGALEEPSVQFLALGYNHKEEVELAYPIDDNLHNFKGTQSSLTIITPQRVVLSTSGYHTITTVEIVTGRKHQIRAVMKYLGHPVTGDKVYGNNTDKRYRQLLHSYNIIFQHPLTNESIEINAPLPADIQKFLRHPTVKKLSG